MAFTVGDIRKALSKYSDDTIVAGKFDDNSSIVFPLRKSGAFKVRQIGKNQLFGKPWLKADLDANKVIVIDYEPEYSNEFFSDTNSNAHPCWKSRIATEDREIANLKPLSHYL